MKLLQTTGKLQNKGFPLSYKQEKKKNHIPKFLRHSLNGFGKVIQSH